MIIKNLEHKLQSMVEDRLSTLFGGQVRLYQLGRHLLKALEDNLQGDIVPDVYLISVSSEVAERLNTRPPDDSEDLAVLLAGQLFALAKTANWRMNQYPVVRFVEDRALDKLAIQVNASFSQINLSSTTQYEAIAPPPVDETLLEAYLVLENGTHLPLQKPIINIGRHQDNQIVIQDPTASRAHCQLRVRWGNYILFDLQSKAGTFVNDRKIKEHRLQSGDVIRVAGTRLIYLEYNNEAENRTRAGDTQTDVDPL